MICTCCCFRPRPPLCSPLPSVGADPVVPRVGAGRCCPGGALCCFVTRASAMYRYSFDGSAAPSLWCSCPVEVQRLSKCHNVSQCHRCAGPPRHRTQTNYLRRTRAAGVAANATKRASPPTLTPAVTTMLPVTGRVGPTAAPRLPQCHNGIAPRRRRVRGVYRLYQRSLAAGQQVQAGSGGADGSVGGPTRWRVSALSCCLLLTS